MNQEVKQAALKRVQSTPEGDITLIPIDDVPDKEIDDVTVVQTQSLNVSTTQYEISRTYMSKIFLWLQQKWYSFFGELPKNSVYNYLDDNVFIPVYKPTGFDNTNSHSIVPVATINVKEIATYFDQLNRSSGAAFDKYIRTQQEFEAMIRTPGWGQARNILFDQGTNYSIPSSYGQTKIQIPETVTLMTGKGSATINVGLSGFEYIAPTGYNANKRVRPTISNLVFTKEVKTTIPVFTGPVNIYNSIFNIQSAGITGAYSVWNCEFNVSAMDSAVLNTITLSKNINNCLINVLSSSVSGNVYAVSHSSFVNNVRVSVSSQSPNKVSGFFQVSYMSNCSYFEEVSVPASKFYSPFEFCNYLSSCYAKSSGTAYKSCSFVSSSAAIAAESFDNKCTYVGSSCRR